jgi:hypothetical protein
MGSKPDIYGKVAGRLWEVCRTSMGSMPDVYGKQAGHLWEVCRTSMGNSHTETSYAQNAVFFAANFLPSPQKSTLQKSASNLIPALFFPTFSPMFVVRELLYGCVTLRKKKYNAIPRKIFRHSSRPYHVTIRSHQAQRRYPNDQHHSGNGTAALERAACQCV